MTARKFQISVQVEIHLNGYTLGEYDISTDSFISKVAKTSVELEQLFYEWAGETGKKLSKLDEERHD